MKDLPYDGAGLVEDEEERDELPWLAPISRAALLRYGLTIGGSSLLAGQLTPRALGAIAGLGANATLRVGIPGTVASFDPAFAYADRPSLYTLLATNSTYVKYGVKPITLKGGAKARIVNARQVLPSVASYRFLAPDVLRLTFARGMRFANGHPLDARAAHGAFARQIGIGAAGAYLFGIVGLKSIANVKLAPNNSLDIHLAKANRLILDMLVITAGPTDPLEMKQHATKKDKWAAAYYKGHLASEVGPYRMISYKPGQSIVLDRFDAWRGPKPYYKQVVQRLIQDPTQTLLLLRRGEIDVADAPPASQLDALRRDKNIAVLSWPSSDPNYLYMNERMAPFDNKLVRQAIAYATPYDEIIRTAYNGEASPLLSILSPTFPGYTKSWTYRTDLAKAAAALQQAGFPNGQGLPSIKITTKASKDEDKRIALLLQQSLKKIGVNVDVETLPDANFLDQHYGFKLQASIFDFPSFFWDAYYHATWNLKSDSVANFTGYKDSEVDQILSKYYVTTDNAGRLRGMKRVQEIFNRDAPMIPLGLPNYHLAVRKQIKGSTYWNDANIRYQYFSG